MLSVPRGTREWNTISSGVLGSENSWKDENSEKMAQNCDKKAVMAIHAKKRVRAKKQMHPKIVPRMDYVRHTAKPNKNTPIQSDDLFNVMNTSIQEKNWF